MTAAARSWVLVAGWAIATLLAVLVPPLAAAAAATDDPEAVGSTMLFAIGVGGLAFLTATVGLVLLLRVPGNRVGSLMYVGGPLIASGGVGWCVTFLFEAAGGPTDARAGLAALWTEIAIPVAVFVGFTAVGIYFPDGHLPSRRLRVPFGTLVVGFIVSSVLFAVAPRPIEGEVPANPLALPGVPVAVWGLGSGLSNVSLLASFGLAAWAAFVRWRRSQGIERAQMKWFVFSLAVALFLLPLSWLTDPAEHIGGDVVDVASIASMALVPIAIGVAILRYRLYEIDRIISRTIGWAVVTGILVTVFALLVVGPQALLAPLTNNDTLAVAASTLLAAALFQPVRARVQRAVDRRFNRSRVDAQAAIDAFVTHVRDEVDLATLHGRLLATVHTAIQPSDVALWTREAER